MTDDYTFKTTGWIKDCKAMDKDAGYPYKKGKASKVVTTKLASMDDCASFCHQMTKDKCMYWSWSLENAEPRKRQKLSFVCRWIPYEAVNLLQPNDVGKYFVMGDRYCHDNKRKSKLQSWLLLVSQIVPHSLHVTICCCSY